MPGLLEDKSEMHETEPYCYAQSVTGRASGDRATPKTAGSPARRAGPSSDKPGHTRRLPGLRRPAHPALHPRGLGRVHRNAEVPRRRVRDTRPSHGRAEHHLRRSENRRRPAPARGGRLRRRRGDAVSAFPAGFVWGAASSAYQVEGFSTADGGGPSIWDAFCRAPGNILYGDTGDIACDSYHRCAEDVALLRELGASAYRFSVSWARVDPQGDGRWNEAGMAYYDKLINLCLESGVEPVVTLYHWELPQPVEDRGGWLSAETARAFARYAGEAASRFKGRVKLLFHAQRAAVHGRARLRRRVHAPGKRLDTGGLLPRPCKTSSLRTALRCAPSGSLRLIRRRRDSVHGQPLLPREREPTRRLRRAGACFAVDERDWMFTHNWLLDPICMGRTARLRRDGAGAARRRRNRFGECG